VTIDRRARHGRFTRWKCGARRGDAADTRHRIVHPFGARFKFNDGPRGAFGGHGYRGGYFERGPDVAVLIGADIARIAAYAGARRAPLVGR
jgi:hypothetical protein